MGCYIAISGDVIWGVGGTPGSALSAARSECPKSAFSEDEVDFEIREATQALTDSVVQDGNCAWGQLASGVCCTVREEAAEADRLEALGARQKVEAEALAGHQPDRVGCEDWAGERRGQYAAMAAAYVAGHPHVALTRVGTLAWAPEAPRRTDCGPMNPVCPLSQHRLAAANEMADNLRDYTWRNRIAQENADRAAASRRMLEAVGYSIYGPEWVSPIARDLGVSLRTAQRWASGEIEVPGRIVGSELALLAKTAVDRGTDRDLERRAEAIREMAARCVAV
jgi:hypothetical protein